MSKTLYSLVVILGLVLATQAEPPRPRLRFPGPVNNRPLPFLAHQEAAPYPAAGLKPEPPFELPTEEAANFPAPDETYGPPDETYGPPDETYGPPDETYGPPEDNNALPQTASIIDSRLFFPQTQLTLPRFERLIAFRPRRPSAAPPQRRPQGKPTKLRRRPQPKPAKLIVSVGTRPQQGFAQLQPIERNPVYVGGRIIAYSDRQQNW